MKGQLTTKRMEDEIVFALRVVEQLRCQQTSSIHLHKHMLQKLGVDATKVGGRGAGSDIKPELQDHLMLFSMILARNEVCTWFAVKTACKARCQLNLDDQQLS